MMRALLYEESLSALSNQESEAMRQAAVEYNERIYAAQQHTDFMYQGEEYEDEEYDSILTPLENSLVMCYIEIPRIRVYLPVTHGTRTEDLEYQVGHMRGTSVPIGGENTHAVIAAHTGLQNADLFTDVVKLEIGDVFYIHVLGEGHVYTVDQIMVVLPGEEVPYIQIEEGQDYVTLFTCTPYGINDHRLLVRGTRTYPDLSRDGQAGDSSDVGTKNMEAWLTAIGYGLIPFVILVLGLWWVNKKRKKKVKVPANAAENNDTPAPAQGTDADGEAAETGLPSADNCEAAGHGVNEEEK